MLHLRKILAIPFCLVIPLFGADRPTGLLNDVVDVSVDFKDYSNSYYLANTLANFDAAAASGEITWSWYQEKIAALLKMGVGAIKVDFGEAAPLMGVYANGRAGFYEHNLYPLRYNKAVAEITKQVSGDNIIWARSAWAGSQRYPLHWGGDAANTNTAMAATLRGGLSFGLSGFSFWSHDIGGFVKTKPEDIYRRWTPFGMLSSHI